jgi:hypothetical protein
MMVLIGWIVARCIPFQVSALPYLLPFFVAFSLYLYNFLLPPSTSYIFHLCFYRYLVGFFVCDYLLRDRTLSYRRRPGPRTLFYKRGSLRVVRGRILGRNWDHFSLKSFPHCYSKSPLITDLTPFPPEQKWFDTGL